MKVPEGIFEGAVDWVLDVHTEWIASEKQGIENFLIGGYSVFKTALNDQELGQAGAFVGMMLAAVGLNGKRVPSELNAWPEGQEPDENDALKALAAYEKFSSTKLICGKVDGKIKLTVPKQAGCLSF